MKVGHYAEALCRFAERPVVTIGAGATCAYLGDERNLREFLVADETAKRLRQAGHTVFSLLIDDSFDPLDFRQLRVAVNKDETLLERYKDWCGKPIGLLPDPWGCHESYAAHFEHALLERLHRLDCHPTLVSTLHLYERGLYAPYVQTTLENYEAVLRFLAERFAGYHPEKLFWVLCPHCGYIDETRIEAVRERCVQAWCHRCDRSLVLPFAELRGKLNWKLDCAARWAMLKIDAEPFNKAYLEPKAGTFTIAQALSQEFFGGHPVMPLQYGLVKMEKQYSYKLLESLPADVLRSLMVESPATDITLTRDLLVTTAARHEVLPKLSYLDAIKQLLPIWMLTPETLTPRQRDLLAHGIIFARNFLDTEIRLRLPAREQLTGQPPETLHALRCLLAEVIGLREQAGSSWETFDGPVREALRALGSRKGDVLHQLRLIVGQQQGLPAARILFLLPLDYLSFLEYILTLQLERASAQTAGLHPLLAA